MQKTNQIENQLTKSSSRIYVACLAAYNNGFLHGAWIDANQEEDQIYSEIKEMLMKSPIPMAEEWAIHDYEGFEGLSLSEYESIASVVEMANIIEEFGEAWTCYVDHVGVDYATREGYEDAYRGEWDSEEAFAENFADETMDIPKHLEYYIDYKQMAHDMFISDYFSAEGGCGAVHVFSRI